jgi:ubiquitin C-terminal hydrolase
MNPLRLIDCPVNNLDLTSCVANPQLPEEYFEKTRIVQEGEEDKVLYDLIGISNHFGSTGGGHYTAYCK